MGVSDIVLSCICGVVFWSTTILLAKIISMKVKLSIEQIYTKAKYNAKLQEQGLFKVVAIAL